MRGRPPAARRWRPPGARRLTPLKVSGARGGARTRRPRLQLVRPAPPPGAAARTPASLQSAAWRNERTLTDSRGRTPKVAGVVALTSGVTASRLAGRRRGRWWFKPGRGAERSCRRRRARRASSAAAAAHDQERHRQARGPGPRPVARPLLLDRSSPNHMMDIAAQNPLKITPALFPPSKDASFIAVAAPTARYALARRARATPPRTYDNLQTRASYTTARDNPKPRSPPTTPRSPRSRRPARRRSTSPFLRYPAAAR